MPHTPEPWSIHRVADEISIVSPYAHTSFNVICQVYHTAGARCEPAETDTIAMANAELLVRAPRMARVLVSIESLVKFYAEREINAPANNQEAVRDTYEKLREFERLLADLRKAGVL